MEQGSVKRTLHPIKLLSLSYGLDPNLRQHLKDAEASPHDVVNKLTRARAPASETAGPCRRRTSRPALDEVNRLTPHRSRPLSRRNGSSRSRSLRVAMPSVALKSMRNRRANFGDGMSGKRV